MTANRSPHYQQLRELCIAIAGELGSGWAIKGGEAHWSQQITGPDRQELWISTGYQALDRLQIAGDYPTDMYGRIPHVRDSPRITLAANRSPKALARDIQRRLLPGYQLTLKQVLERQADQMRRFDLREQVAQRLIAAAGPDANLGSRDANHERHHVSLHPGMATVSYGGGTVDLEIPGLEPDEAVAMLTRLCQLMDTRRAANAAKARTA